ncbi:phage scaffolding protein [Parafrankia discariae]|uniref:phage scaffolding protein n=1 Tax=Parafrankia discariae TaxID=365528 RepID=UPI00037FB2D5|nr:hypothetical protein [Parafrankia discariae]
MAGEDNGPDDEAPETEEGQDPQDDEGQDDGPDNSDAGDGDDGDARDSRPKGPTADQWKRTQAALAKANEEARKFRLEARTLRDEKRSQERATRTAGDEHAAAVEAARDEGEQTATARYKPLAIRAQARAELVAAGAPAEKVARLLRLIELEQVDVDPDGDVTGLDDQINQIRVDYPELFAQPKVSRPRGDGADKRPEPNKPKSSAAALAARLGG